VRGVVLPGDRSVAFVEVPDPVPGPGQVVIAVEASGICGSDIRAIYRGHVGEGPERYQGVIAGHEPAGSVVAAGPGCARLRPGDRVAVYHVAGCGACPDCRRGYMIDCRGPGRAAYGWQRDGGHAPYLLAEERTCIPLPEGLTAADGALAACGFGTAHEALARVACSGRDRLFVAGLGPVGLAAAMLGRAMGAAPVIGADTAPERCDQARRLGLVDVAVPVGQGPEGADAALDAVLRETAGEGCEVTIDCSGSGAGQLLAVRATRRWGRCALVGEGGRLTLDVSPQVIHRQISLHGSWVTSLWGMEALLERLARWNLHPEAVVTHRFPLAQAAEAHRVADGGRGGKVVLEPAGG
jgi:threonine dehydrogenase-like Zn-dependent dehydrogenase